MEDLTRQEVIDRLVSDEIDSIEQMILGGDYSYIDTIIRDGGISGFSNLCNEDLVAEYYSKFDELIEIK
jgi:hypothetical protein